VGVYVIISRIVNAKYKKKRKENWQKTKIYIITHEKSHQIQIQKKRGIIIIIIIKGTMVMTMPYANILLYTFTTFKNNSLFYLFSLLNSFLLGGLFVFIGVKSQQLIK